MLVAAYDIVATYPYRHINNRDLYLYACLYFKHSYTKENIWFVASQWNICNLYFMRIFENSNYFIYCQILRNLYIMILYLQFTKITLGLCMCGIFFPLLNMNLLVYFVYNVFTYM